MYGRVVVKKQAKVAVMNFFKQRRRTFLSALAIGAFFVSGCGWDDDGDDMGTTMVTASGVNYEGPLVYGGRTYKTAVIGKKVWMAENLNYVTSSGSWCYENHNPSCNKYGRLYDWKTAMTACPSGWYLPSRQDWKDLVETVGGVGKANKMLKARTGWNNNGNGTDDFGFSALPGGYRNLNGVFNEAGSYSYWWTATERTDNYAHMRIMSYSSAIDDRIDFNDNMLITRGDINKGSGSSVRCVKE